MTTAARIVTFRELAAMLDDAPTAGDRAAAVRLAADTLPPNTAAWLRRRMHLIVRGGAPALRRELATEIPTEDAPTVRLRASTRTDEPALRFTAESGLDLLDATVGPDHKIHATGISTAEFGYWLLSWHPDGSPAESAQVGQPREDHARLGIAPDGSRVAVTSNRALAVHALPGFAPLHQLHVGEAPIAVCHLADGRLVTGGNGYVYVFAPDGTELAAAETDGTAELAVMPDERSIVLPALFGCGLVWHELPSLRPTRTLTTDRTERRIDAVAVSPCGRWAVTGDWTHEVLRWDLRDGGTEVLGRHDGWVSRVAFTDESTVVSGGWDGTVRVWELDSPGGGRILGRHAGHVVAVVRSGDDVVTAASDGTVKVWDPHGEPAGRPPPFPFPYGGQRPDLPLRRTVSGSVEVLRDDRRERWNYDAQRVAVLPTTARITRDTKRRLSADFPLIGRSVRADGRQPCFTVHDAAGELVDTVHTPDPVHAMAPAGRITVGVLDRGGHLSFWDLADVDPGPAPTEP